MAEFKAGDQVRVRGFSEIGIVVGYLGHGDYSVSFSGVRRIINEGDMQKVRE